MWKKEKLSSDAGISIHLWEHEQGDQWRHQEQETGAYAAAAAVAEVALTADMFSPDGSSDLCTLRVCAHVSGGAALHGFYLTIYIHWENGIKRIMWG